jgi:solute carrier family 25 phosphate transporter 23/24/25/41
MHDAEIFFSLFFRISLSSNSTLPDPSRHIPLSWDQLQSLKSFLSGGIGSVAAKSATAPFSRVTILMQIQSANIKRKTAVEISAEIYKQDGILAFWRGNFASCLHRFPYSGITFLVQDRVSHMLADSSDFPKSAVDFSSGAVAGGVAACLTYPLDVVRLRLSSQTGPRPHYCGICDAVNRIALEQGTRGFYKGLFPTLIHVVPSFAINFQVFGSLKQRYQSTHSEESSSKGTIPLAEAFYYGCGAGFFSSALLFPVDLVRRQMQADGQHGSREKYSGIRDVIKVVYRRNGIPGFYNGLPSELIKVVPFVGIMFMTVEWLKKLDWPLEERIRNHSSVH